MYKSLTAALAALDGVISRLATIKYENIGNSFKQPHCLQNQWKLPERKESRHIRHNYLLPVAWVFRLVRGATVRRKKFGCELRELSK